jgi:hypothetical protein
MNSSGSVLPGCVQVTVNPLERVTLVELLGVEKVKPPPPPGQSICAEKAPASAVENALAAYSGTTAASHEYFDHTGVVQSIRDAAVSVNREILVICHGGPIAEPDDEPTHEANLNSCQHKQGSTRLTSVKTVNDPVKTGFSVTPAGIARQDRHRR